jgi:hypothetical protein
VVIFKPGIFVHDIAFADFNQDREQTDMNAVSSVRMLLLLGISERSRSTAESNIIGCSQILPRYASPPIILISASG